MRSPGINGEGELRGQPANPGSPGKMAVKMECVCVFTMTPQMESSLLSFASLSDAILDHRQQLRHGHSSYML